MENLTYSNSEIQNSNVTLPYNLYSSFISDHYHRALTDEEKGVIDDPKDYPIFEVINAIPLEDLRLMADCIGYRPGCLSHVNSEQKKWLEKEKYFLGETLGRNVDSIMDLLPDMQEKGIALRYRLFFALKYPDEIELHVPCSRWKEISGIKKQEIFSKLEEVFSEVAEERSFRKNNSF